MTKGTHYNCKCPYCGGMNHYIAHEHKVVPDETTEFFKVCDHCGQKVHYQATLEIEVFAYKEDETT